MIGAAIACLAILCAIGKFWMTLPDQPSLFKPATHLTRRAFTASLLGLPLAACQDSEVVAVRFRVIATVLYKGQPYEASTVMECRYWRVKNSLTGRGGGTKLFGEALIFDLPDGAGTFYILPWWRDSALLEIYEPGLLTTLGIEDSVGSLRDEDLDRLKKWTGRKVFSYHNHLPTFVAFQNEMRPDTLFEVDPSKIAGSFPNVRFAEIDIEITNDPVTERLKKRLPWLNDSTRKEVFPRDSPGHLRSDRDSPLAFIITKSHFFGKGS